MSNSQFIEEKQRDIYGEGISRFAKETQVGVDSKNMEYDIESGPA